MNEIKFKSVNFEGRPVTHYIATPVVPPTAKPDPAVAHHIVVVDRSGSMWGSMEQLKETVERVMVCEDFVNSKLLVTLISYSSLGDYTVHFSRTPVADIMKPGSKQVEAIRQMRATALTCASQAVEAAVAFIKADETTAITLHSDGYFNDRSPGEEQRAIQKLIKDVLSKRPNVYLNTVAYGPWSDFKTLDSIAAAMSGKCMLAETAKQVYQALHDTSALLAGRSLPAIHIEKGDEDYQIALNLTQKKVNGSTQELVIRGIGVDDRLAIYKIRRVTESAWAKSKATAVDGAQDPMSLVPVYALARTALADGQLLAAKQLLLGTGNEALIRGHWRAVIVEDLAKFAAALDAWIEDPQMVTTWGAPGVPGGTKPDLISLFQLLQANLRDFTVDLDALRAGYTRRGLVDLEGRWVDDGGRKVFQPAAFSAIPTDTGDRVGVGKFQVNNTRATVQMMCVRDAGLKGPNGAVTAVAGRKVQGNLKLYNNYTLVADGAVNASVLPLWISTQRLFSDLRTRGFIPSTAVFDHTQRVDIPLQEFPAVPFTMPVPKRDYAAMAKRLVELTAEASILRGLQDSDEGSTWTAEQLAELKTHHLTPAFYFSPPSTTPYSDRAAAIAAGEIDSRTVTNIFIGTKSALSPAALYSANEYLARRFTVTVDDATDDELAKDGTLKKPKLADLRRPGAKVGRKELTARTKLNAIDDIQMPIMSEILREFPSMTDSHLRARLEATTDAIDEIYQAIQPLVFYVGSFGALPEGWEKEYTLMTADELEKAAEGIEISSTQRNGSFFVSKSGSIISVIPENTWFTTPRGLEAIERIAKVSA